MDVSTGGFQYGRGVIVEPSQAAEIHIYLNDITATNNMAIRVWGDAAGLLQTGSIYNNIIHDIRLASFYGGIYLPEQDSHPAQESMEIYGNTLELNGGNAIGIDSGYGINVHDNTITCYNNDCSAAGWVLHTQEQAYSDSSTAVTIKNMTLPSGWGGRNAIGVCGTGGGYICLAPTHTSAVTYCNTGVVVCGTGATCTESCP
jgi:hypothetical protein